MGLYFEVRSKSRQHLGVLPVHLHVVDLAVETDGTQKSLEVRVVKKKAVSAQVDPLKVAEVFGDNLQTGFAHLIFGQIHSRDSLYA